MIRSARRVLLSAGIAFAIGGAPVEAAAPRLLLDVADGQEAAAREIEAMPPDRLEWAGRLTGLTDLEGAGGPVRIYLRAESSTEARRMPGWVAGYARGNAGEVVLFPSRGRSWPDRSLEGLLIHELTHVLVARAAGGRPVPRWFNEGVAMAASGAATVEDQTRFLFERLRTGRVPLAQVDLWFGGNAGDVRRAYAVAGAFVRSLIERHGPEVVADVLQNVRSGVRFEDAFHRATGESLAAAESTFWEDRGGWVERYVPFLTSSLALWMLGALLVLVALWRRRKKTKELEAKWEAQGLGDDPGGPGSPPRKGF